MKFPKRRYRATCHLMGGNKYTDSYSYSKTQTKVTHIRIMQSQFNYPITLDALFTEGSSKRQSY